MAKKHSEKSSFKLTRTKHTYDLPILLLASVGMVITAYLTGVNWFETAPALCSPGSGCDVIQHSRYSSVLGLPLALWGFALYALIAYVAYRPTSRLRRWKRLWNLALVGVAISIYLTLLGIIVLDAVCLWCLASLALMIAILATVTVRRPPSAPDMPWWNWLLNGAVLAIVCIGVLHVYYHFSNFQAPDDPRLEALAEHLDESGATFYGAFWCSNCNQQKRLFGDASEQLPYVECSPAGRGGLVAMACQEKNIQNYPTWIIDDKRYTGVLEPEELAQKSGFDW